MNATSKRSKRLFTVAEANQMLPLVRAIVSDIVELFREVHDRRDRIARIRQFHKNEERAEGNLYREELDQIEEELEKDTSRLRGYFDELSDLGVEFKDPVEGLVDFRTKIEGREAYLCWKLGEDEVAHWHELDAGYGGRQSLLHGTVTTDDEAQKGTS
jgi:hypothetical protein